MTKIKVVQYGIGEIGKMITKLLLDRNIKIVAAIDKKNIGRDLGEFVGRGKIGVKISNSDILKKIGADAVLHATSSYLKDVYPQITECIEAGINVISTCEELSHPDFNNKLAKNIDKLARNHGVTVLGTGINPGFAMDMLPILFTSLCKRIDKIEVQRFVNLSERRESLRKRLGIGLRRSEFEKHMRHVGLKESLNMIASATGLDIDKTAEYVKPIVKKGRLVGIEQHARGFVNGKIKIILNLQMKLNAESFDRIKIKGEPNIDLLVKGIQGDIATAAIVVNSIKRVMRASPGLITMKDLPVPSFSG